VSRDFAISRIVFVHETDLAFKYISDINRLFKNNKNIFLIYRPNRKSFLPMCANFSSLKIPVI